MMARTLRLLVVLLSLQRKRLVKLIIITITLFALYQTFTIRTTESMPLILRFEASNRATHSPGKASLDVLNDHKVTSSGLNAHIWYDICPSSIQAFCHYPLFPKQPNEKTFVKELRLKRRQDHYVQRIFGFLHPPRTGKYRFAIASDDMSELWLSSSEDPSKAVLICRVDEWVPQGDFQRHASQISSVVKLQQHHKYYVEILHGQLGEDDFLDVVWSLPGMGGTFKPISLNNTSVFVNDSHNLHNYHMEISSTVCESRPHHQHKKENSNALPEYLSHQTVADVLPYCNYTPSYLTKMDMPVDKPKNYYQFLSNHYFPVESYPPVEYENVVNPAFANHELDIVEAQKAAKLFMDSLHQHYPGKFKILELANVERKLDEKFGSRFLLEFLVEVSGQDKPVMISEFVFLAKDSEHLCYPKGLQWNRQAKVALVISVKDQGRWLAHFLNNLEEMYAVTKDENVELVLFNYESSDINLQQELAVRTLPPCTVIKAQAEHYSRSRSLNKGVQMIQDPHTIIFTLDLHLDLPITLFDDIRKHCFEGRSVYAPVIIRLECGETPAMPNGRWEPYGFGLAGIYKSDWDRIGGLNEKLFDKKWGGEDWDLMERVVSNELEYERVRHPKIFHYYHSRRGTWTGDEDISNKEPA